MPPRPDVVSRLGSRAHRSRDRIIARIIEGWFESHQRFLPWRASYDPYHVWVSEVMLQQTRMEVVLRAYGEFLVRFPTLDSLAAASDDEVLAAWSGLGYYRRARMLRDGARAVTERFDGKIPDDVNELQTIPGIGRYTAGAISSIAFGRHAPIVDGNVARIVARLKGIEECAGSSPLMRAAWGEAERLVEACASPQGFNQGLMELGALVCKPVRPACEACPLTSHCIAFESGRTALLPRPRRKQETHEMRVALYLVVDSTGRTLLVRNGTSLMKAMFHLPHGNCSLLPSTDLEVVPRQQAGSFRHTITNRRIVFEVWTAGLAPGIRETAAETIWVRPDELHSVPHSSYVAKALRMLSAREMPVSGPPW